MQLVSLYGSLTFRGRSQVPLTSSSLHFPSLRTRAVWIATRRYGLSCKERGHVFDQAPDAECQRRLRDRVYFGGHLNRDLCSMIATGAFAVSRVSAQCVAGRLQGG